MITVLSVEFVTTSDHEGDAAEVVLGEDTVVGALAADVSPASAWSDQNYTAGQVVTYTHPVFGSLVYTCTTNTVSNENPTNATYWKHGLAITVTQTVIDNTQRGFVVKLSDGTNTDNVGRVISIDDTNNKIYVETNLSNSFAAATPTYIKATVQVVHDYEIGPGWEHKIGDSKIGGSTLPEYTLVSIKYTNNGESTKSIIGRVEYMY